MNETKTNSGSSDSIELESIDLPGNIEFFGSKDVKGTLTVGEKIYFNHADGKGCLLRICGFTRPQIKKMLNASFIDITLMTNDNDEGTFMIDIKTTISSE